MTALQVHPSDLEPSPVGHRTYLTRGRSRLLDTGAVLIGVLVLAILIPANLVVPQLTGISRPTLMLGLLAAAGWFLARLHPRFLLGGPQPLRWAGATYLVAVLLAYAAGYLRGLPPLEANAADRAMIGTLVFVGVALVAADGLPNRARLDDVLRWLVWLATVMALIGHIQFAFNVDIAAMIQIPGLANPFDPIGFRDRGDGFFQVASTASHYIEFSVVMAMAVPLGIHVSRFGRSPRTRQAALVCTVLIAAAVPVTLSRSGFAALFAGMLAMAVVWRWRMRFNVAVAGLGMIGALMLVRPGLLGTIQSLFLNLGNDPSIEGRTEDYDATSTYLADRPWFGRGPGTFIPTLYRWLDNEWLMHLITVGIVGTAALAVWHLTAIWLAWKAYRRAGRDADRDLCACLIAAQVMAMVAAATFDAMSFTTHTTVLAVLTGAAGAMWRFTHPARLVRNAAAVGLRPEPTGPPRP